MLMTILVEGPGWWRQVNAEALQVFSLVSQVAQ
jgi:hypothetical protein